MAAQELQAKLPTRYQLRMQRSRKFISAQERTAAKSMKVKSANYSVYCAFYDIDLKNMISSLAKKSRNIDVKLVIDGSNFKEQIKGDGVRVENEDSLMHNKFCVIDSYIVLSGSFNPTLSADTKNDENVLIIHDKKIANEFLEEFGRLWQ